MTPAHNVRCCWTGKYIHTTSFLRSYISYYYASQTCVQGKISASGDCGKGTIRIQAGHIVQENSKLQTVICYQLSISYRPYITHCRCSMFVFCFRRCNFDKITLFLKSQNEEPIWPKNGAVVGKPPFLSMPSLAYSRLVVRSKNRIQIGSG